MSKEIIIFTSSTCAPCKVVKPILESLCAERLIPLRAVEMNIDNRETFMRHNVRSVPTVVCVDGEKEIGRFIGATTMAEVEHTLDMWGFQ